MSELRELITATLWHKNYSELLKAERPAVDELAKKLSAELEKAKREARIDEIKLAGSNLRWENPDYAVSRITQLKAELQSQQVVKEERK